MDWNPFNSSLFTGAGTPWGANDLPTLQDLMAAKPNQDVNAYQGFDTSPLKAALGNAIKTNAARGRNNLAGSFAKLGVEGADRNNAMAQASADENAALAGMQSDLAMKEYQSKVDALNRANAMWGQQLGMSGNEAKQRGDFWNSALTTVGRAGETAAMLAML